MTHEELKSQIAKLLEGNNDPEKNQTSRRH